MRRKDSKKLKELKYLKESLEKTKFEWDSAKAEIDKVVKERDFVKAERDEARAEAGAYQKYLYNLQNGIAYVLGGLTYVVLDYFGTYKWKTVTNQVSFVCLIVTIGIYSLTRELFEWNTERKKKSHMSREKPTPNDRTTKEGFDDIRKAQKSKALQAQTKSENPPTPSVETIAVPPTVAMTENLSVTSMESAGNA